MLLNPLWGTDFWSCWVLESSYLPLNLLNDIEISPGMIIGQYLNYLILEVHIFNLQCVSMEIRSQCVLSLLNARSCNFFFFFFFFLRCAIPTWSHTTWRITSRNTLSFTYNAYFREGLFLIYPPTSETIGDLGLINVSNFVTLNGINPQNQREKLLFLWNKCTISRNTQFF